MISEPLILTSEFSPLTLQIDPSTGAALRIWESTHPSDALDLLCSVRLVTQGTEHRGATGGLDYRDTVDVHLAAGGTGNIREKAGLGERTFEVPAATSAPDMWSAVWRYTFREFTPRLAIELRVHAHSDDAIARNIHFDIGAMVSDPEMWRVNSPGNQLRTDLQLSALHGRTAISPAGGLKGSVGLVALDRIDRNLVCILWPLSQTEIGDISLQPASVGLTVEWQTDVAGRPGADGALTCSTFYVDYLHDSFATYLRTVPDDLSRMGITSPNSAPVWSQHANIYEVQIGFSVFADGYKYAPYASAADLLADLGRIHELGYNTLQIMPRQPYPSYNVHDFDDITTSYGDESTLVQVIDECHARGMKVIVDILLHGVIDRESIREAVAAIRSGPYNDRLRSDVAIEEVPPLSEDESYLLAWSRHIIDFEEYWIQGSPESHPLIEQHPEWFCRDSAGEVIGIYTKSFDLAHPGWQDFFIRSALGIVSRLQIDGFRFDAPTYNYFSNWSLRTRHNAAVSTMGCLPLFDKLRGQLKRLDPEALMYTEPSGVLHRMAMDLNYNYDEHWLIDAVMGTGTGGSASVRNARELGQWLSQRDATLPVGSVTAHHIDSHDTFWWPVPGQKWRREQFGLAATSAWMSVFALSGGPYMTFVGGEFGIEGHVRAVNTIRRDSPWFVRGTSDYESIHCSDDRVYAVLRRSDEGTGVLLVNLSEHSVSTVCTIRQGVIASAEARLTLTAELGGRTESWVRGDDGWCATLLCAPFETVVFSSVPW